MILICSILMSSCLDYEEEMWVNPDLSGRVSMKISVPEEIVRGNTGLERDLTENGLRDELEKIPGVKLESFQSFREAGKVIANAKITFEDVEQLTRYEQGVAESTAASMLGSIKVTEEGRKVKFERTLNTMPKARNDEFAKDFLTKSLSSLLFSKNYISYKIHVPSAIITANSQHIDGEEQIVEWKYTLSQAMREPPEMLVEWKKPFPFLMVFVVILTGAASVAFIWWRKANPQAR